MKQLFITMTVCVRGKSFRTWSHIWLEQQQNLWQDSLCNNYDTAVDLLQNLFQRKNILISIHMPKLNLAPVKKSSDVVALRNWYDGCEIQIFSLESLGVHSDTYALLCPVLLQLIPEDIVLAYTHKSDPSGEWKVLKLIQFLQNEVQSRAAYQTR